MTRTNLVAALLLLVVFLTGLTSGIVIQQLLSSPPSMPSGPWPRFPNPAEMRGDGRSRPGRFDSADLARQLDLSAEQEQVVDSIIRNQQQRMDSLLMSIRPNIEHEFRALSEGISAVLTPAQRVEFEQFVDEGFARLGTRRPLPLPRERSLMPPVGSGF